MSDLEKSLRTYIDFFEQLKPGDLPYFDRIFSANVHFKDPFNDVYGPAALKQIFTHMFERCEDPRFEVTDACQAEDRAYLRWDFHFNLRGRSEKYRLQGVSRVCFDANGRVYEHIDYWDPTEQIYGRLPVLRWVLAIVRSRLSAPQVAAD